MENWNKIRVSSLILGFHHSNFPIKKNLILNKFDNIELKINNK
jgi:hypothetical protein